MTKKKTTYRYHESMQPLIDKGFKMYENMYSGTMTLNAFLDICVKSTVETFPEQLQNQAKLNAELQKKIEDLEKKNEEMMHTIRAVHQLNVQQYKVKEQVIKLINQE
ncbi:MAG: hypothetical protein N4A71_10995 [Carboxylicivirga sp.]|jgi:hypothetical protein|nr:hypothetical protein [Carboxylicivirga sp.]